jgi:chromosome partitioning protein
VRRSGDAPQASPWSGGLSPGTSPVRRIAFVNEKGGTGKTTLAVHVAAWIARARKLRVLLVDMDTQGHAGKTLGLDVREIQPNVFHFLTDRSMDLARVRHATEVPGLGVVPAYKQMAGLAAALGSASSAAERLGERLDEFGSEQDVVVIDGPPSLGLSVTAMLVAATEVVVPVALTYLALDGCAEVARSVERIAEEHHRPSLRVSAVVPMMHRRTALAEAVRERLEAYFPGRVTPPLGISVAIDEAQSHGKTVWDYAPRSRGAQMMSAVAEAVWALGERGP